ncbi:MAG: DUF2279 domain-containing protein [Bacteroidales bacterium]|nr:DUF2279 domain-containing protein [Bacteroidales bacterium]
MVDFKDSLTLTSKQKTNLLITGGSIVYASSLTGLYYLWYKDYPQSSFHFFNDNSEWLQMDKCAHATTSYYLGSIGHHALLWAGLDERKAIWYGGFAGTVYLSVIEVLDGFSKEWGFSLGDFASNIGGSLLYCSQQSFGGKQNIRLKYSFSPSNYTAYRPDLLGNNYLQSTLKDYNGISCWASFNLKMFFENYDKFPDWICLSIGQSGDGLLGANGNPAFNNGHALPYFDRQRQLLFSADIDLSRLPISNKYLKVLTNVLSFIKIPFPTLEYNKTEGIVFHPLYF